MNTEAIQLDQSNNAHWQLCDSPRASVWLSVRYLLRKSFCLIAFAASLFPFLYMLSDLHPAIELLNHFSMHVLAVTLTCVPLALFLRTHRVAVVLSLSVLVLGWQTAPWKLLPLVDSTSVAGPSIKVLSWNMLATNEHLDRVEQLLREHDPDVVVLIELRPGVAEQIEGLLEAYQWREYRPSWGGEGIGVFSRVQGTRFSYEEFGFARQPSIVANIPGRSGQSSLLLAGIHTLSPLPLRRVSIRNRQLAQLGQWAQQQQVPVIACGDFNTTPWTGPFRQLLAAGFRDSRDYRGNAASWPAELGVLGIPIDHVLARGACRVWDRRTLPQVGGSDHCPILFQVAYDLEPPHASDRLLTRQ